jgi:putative sterol carrier protein
MLKFGSLEYMNEVMKRTNADAEYERVSKEETGSFTMILGAEPANGIPQEIVVGYREEKGKITEVWMGERQTDFVLSGPYGVWVDILLGKLGASKAFVMRKLKVRGNFLRILQSSDSTMRWLEILRTIPTEFEGSYASSSIKGTP